MNRFWMLGIRAGLGLLLAAGLPASSALAGHDSVYRVVVTNLTKAQSFTPILAATHSHRVELFELGKPASPELEILAEDGNTEPLSKVLEEQRHAVGEVLTRPGLLAPGETAKFEIRSRRRHGRISVAAMLIPTNDSFFALNGAALPRYGSKSFDVPAYDAGTEENDQHCDHIPGPVCEGQGHSPEPAEGDEGHIFIGNGFHELDPADDDVLGPFRYDWRNPVARVTVRRVY